MPWMNSISMLVAHPLIFPLIGVLFIDTLQTPERYREWPPDIYRWPGDSRRVLTHREAAKKFKQYIGRINYMWWAVMVWCFSFFSFFFFSRDFTILIIYLDWSRRRKWGGAKSLTNSSKWPKWQDRKHAKWYHSNNESLQLDGGYRLKASTWSSRVKEWMYLLGKIHRRQTKVVKHNE